MARKKTVKTAALVAPSAATKRAPVKKKAAKVEPRKRGTKRKPVQISMDPATLDRLDAWRKKQLVPPDRSTTVQTMIAEWLDRHDR